MAVADGAPKKSSGCGSIGAGILLLALVLLVLLMLLGILPNPLEAEPTATSLPGIPTNEPSITSEVTVAQSATSNATLTQTLEPTATPTLSLP